MSPDYARTEILRLEHRIAQEGQRLAAARALPGKPDTARNRFIRHRQGDLVLLQSGLRRAQADAVEPAGFDDF